MGIYMQNKKYAEIKTERLLLRTPTDADAAAVRAFGKNEFGTDEDALAFIYWIENRSDVCWNFYIWSLETGQMLGRVYFHSKAELNGQVEIGYGIYEAHRNKGYATEAAKAVIQFAFQQAGQETLAAIVKPKNLPSRRVIEKLGFAYLGIRSVLDQGEYVDFLNYKLPRETQRQQNI